MTEYQVWLDDVCYGFYPTLQYARESVSPVPGECLRIVAVEVLEKAEPVKPKGSAA